jgi:dTDP-4-dehydrorhamnose reductase
MYAKKKIYMAGVGGMLGAAFHEVFAEDYDLRCTDINVNESWLSRLDFRDFDAYASEVAAFQPNYLFHIGAHTDLEYCEINVKDAYLTNTIAAENAVYIANKHDIPLLYISTAGIFDGSKDTFDDWDLPNPLGHYARSTYAGELFVQNTVRQHLICRAGWMMGGGPRKDKKFVQKLAAQIKSGRKRLHVVNDKLGTPTYTNDFAHNVKLLIEKEYWGLYNVVCSDVTGRLEVAQEIVRILGLANEIEIVEVDSTYFKKEYFAERPPSERLIDRKLELRNLNVMRDWRTCLREYLEKEYKGYF